MIIVNDQKLKITKDINKIIENSIPTVFKRIPRQRIPYPYYFSFENHI